jgi:predicted MFS family arabinose efflux permease
MTPEPNNVIPAPRLGAQLLAATFARTVINTAQRMVYPFLPVLSRGLGVPLEALTTILSLRGALGLTAPLFGSLPERFGKRNALLIAMCIFTLGLSIVGIFPNLYTVCLAILLVIVTKFIFDPALQAYLSERTPYSRRGLVIGLTEFGWSGAVLVGVPVVGYLINWGDWHSAYLPLAFMGLLAGVWIAAAIPADAAVATHPDHAGFAKALTVLRHPVVLAALSMEALISAANESFSVIYGQWLENSFALSVVELGLTTVIIGVAELIAEGGVAGLSDRMGKRRTVAIGLGLSALSYFVLPLISKELNGALIGIFFVYLTFEFAIVASLPLISELLPERRNAVMSTSIASQSAGRMIGALLGGFLFKFGFAWTGLAAGLMTLAGIPLIIWFVKERK